MNISTADLHDANPDNVDVCEFQFRSIGTRLSFRGPCVTVKVFEDHRRIKALVEEPVNGRVLVIDGGGDLPRNIRGPGAD